MDINEINKVAEEISKRDDFNLVYIYKIKLWFKWDEDSNSWFIANDDDVKDAVDKVLYERFTEAVEYSRVNSAYSDEFDSGVMETIQKAIDMYKEKPKERIFKSMKKFARNDGEILTRHLNNDIVNDESVVEVDFENDNEVN